MRASRMSAVRCVYHMRRFPHEITSVRIRILDWSRLSVQGRDECFHATDLCGRFRRPPRLRNAPDFALEIFMLHSSGSTRHRLLGLGWKARWRGAQTWAERERAASTARAASPWESRARHVARASGASAVSRTGHRARNAAAHLGGERLGAATRSVPRRALLRAGQSRSHDRGSPRWACAVAWRSGARDSARASREQAPRNCGRLLVGALQLTRADCSALGAQRDRLRPHEREEALRSRPERLRRSVLVGALVRRFRARSVASGRSITGERREHVARIDWMASSWPDPTRRAPARAELIAHSRGSSANGTPSKTQCSTKVAACTSMP
jgi:hypothetical protein